METRKIQLTGESTYTVSLPKKWADKMKLSAGDSVTLIPQPNGTLLMDPRLGSRRSAKKKVISAHNETVESLFRKLVGAYIAGFTVIEVRGGRGVLSPGMKGMIRDFRRKVIGFEVVDETQDSVTLQDLLDSVDLPPKKALRRMSILVEKMFRDAWTVLSERSTALAEDVLSRDDEVDRLCWLIDKQYHSMLRDLGYAEKMEVGLEECLQFLTVAKLLERIGDHAVRICGTVISGSPAVKADISGAMGSVMEIAVQMLLKSVEAMFQGDLVQAEVVAGMRDELNKKYEDAMEKVLKLESRAAVSYTYVLDSMRRTGLYSTDISENAINYIQGLDEGK